MMLKKFLPTQTDFFRLFGSGADKLVMSAELFVKLMHHLEDRDSLCALIAQTEREADKISYTIYESLHATFITPFDREDIHCFTSHLDDVIDAIHVTSQRVALYRLIDAPIVLAQMASVCLQAAQNIQAAIRHLKELKQIDVLIQQCEEVSKLENKADDLMLQGVAELFDAETDIKKILKYKEIFEYTKKIMDDAQDVTNVIKGIVLEYS